MSISVEYYHSILCYFMFKMVRKLLLNQAIHVPLLRQCLSLQHQAGPSWLPGAIEAWLVFVVSRFLAWADRLSPACHSTIPSNLQVLQCSATRSPRPLSCQRRVVQTPEPQLCDVETSCTWAPGHGPIPNYPHLEARGGFFLGFCFLVHYYSVVTFAEDRFSVRSVCGMIHICMRCVRCEAGPALSTNTRISRFGISDAHDSMDQVPTIALLVQLWKALKSRAFVAEGEADRYRLDVLAWQSLESGAIIVLSWKHVEKICFYKLVHFRANRFFNSVFLQSCESQVKFSKEIETWLIRAKGYWNSSPASGDTLASSALEFLLCCFSASPYKRQGNGCTRSWRGLGRAGSRTRDQQVQGRHMSSATRVLSSHIVCSSAVFISRPSHFQTPNLY